MEVNCTDSSPSVGIPWIEYLLVFPISFEETDSSSVVPSFVACLDILAFSHFSDQGLVSFFVLVVKHVIMKTNVEEMEEFEIHPRFIPLD